MMQKNKYLYMAYFRYLSIAVVLTFFCALESNAQMYDPKGSAEVKVDTTEVEDDPYKCLLIAQD